MMKTGEIAKALGKELSNVGHLLRELLNDGLVITPKTGYYQLYPAKEKKETPTPVGIQFVQSS